MIRTSLLILVIYLSPNAGAAQATPSSVEPLSRAQIVNLAQEVTDAQIKFLKSDGLGFSYKSHWRDHELGETTEVIGSADGRASRLLEQNGQPISAQSNEKETKRLQGLLNPGKLQDANKSAKRLQPYFLELINAMPQAMLYTPTPGQPQRLDINDRQIVLDYSPNPTFHPRSLAESTLGKLSGRLWINAHDSHLLRMEIHVDQDVNVAGGLVAKVFAGGTIEYDQRLVVADQYAWTHVRLHLRIRELLVKTIPIDADLTATEIEPLSPVPSGSEAIRLLLNTQVRTR